MDLRPIVLSYMEITLEYTMKNTNYLKIIIIICLISSLARFVLDCYLPSLPSIALVRGTGEKYAQFTLTIYLLGFSISQLFYGPLSDVYGRKKVIILGLTIFAMGNFLCTVSHSKNLLVLGRLIAGIGAGACGVLNRAIANDLFTGEEFAKVWSYTTNTLVITLCIAPVIGGYVEEIAGWRGNFALSTLLVIITLITLLRFLPETHYNLLPQKKTIKLTSILKDYCTILTTREFILGSLCYGFAFSGLIAYFQVSPILFIEHLHFSASTYGWCAVIIALNYLAGGMIVSRFVKKIGTKALLGIGVSLLIIGGISLLMMSVNQYATIYAILFSSSIYVIGARIVIPNAIADSMKNLRHLGGSTSAVLGFIQMSISTLVSFLLSQFDNTSSIPLSGFLLLLGLLSLFVLYLTKKSTPKIMPIS